MSIVTKSFKTEAEAKAFREGVEFVNDSAIEVLNVHQEKKKWIVEIKDEDASPDSDDT